MQIRIGVVSLVLSRRYKSMTICAISLVGGYLPFFSYVFFEGLFIKEDKIKIDIRFLIKCSILYSY